MASNTNESDRAMTLNGKHIMVVFGSGGHTTEMLLILGKSTNIFDKYGKLYFVIGASDNWSMIKITDFYKQ